MILLCRDGWFSKTWSNIRKIVWPKEWCLWCNALLTCIQEVAILRGNKRYVCTIITGKVLKVMKQKLPGHKNWSLFLRVISMYVELPNTPVQLHDCLLLLMVIFSIEHSILLPYNITVQRSKNLIKIVAIQICVLKGQCSASKALVNKWSDIISTIYIGKSNCFHDGIKLRTYLLLTQTIYLTAMTAIKECIESR